MADGEKFLIYYKKNSDEAKKTARLAGECFARRGLEYFVLEAGEPLPPETWDARAAIVLGGDGSALGLARRLAGTSIPVFGINFGTAGFLTAASAGNWEKALCEMLDGELPVKTYMALKWRLVRGGEIISSGVCANDLVLSRCYPAKLVALDILVENQALGRLRGDALIVCSPLGSTGYCVSAGGPVIYAGMNAIGLIPVCPFPLGAASIVIPGNFRIGLVVGESSGECYCTVDGQEGMITGEGDVIEVSGWENALAFYGDESLFFQRLKKRGFALES